jgi:hypothetical protein
LQSSPLPIADEFLPFLNFLKGIVIKEKDVLTDFKAHQVVLYAEKSDNSIGPVQTGSYVSGHYIDEFYNFMGKIERESFEKLQNSEISPICLYMNIEEITLSELASRVGLPKRKVKKHLTHKYFPTVKISELQRYAEIFNIPVANFFQIVSTRQDNKWRPGFKAENAKEKPFVISQISTGNPFVVITLPELNKQ